jgi:hypothetical protein
MRAAAGVGSGQSWPLLGAGALTLPNRLGPCSEGNKLRTMGLLTQPSRHRLCRPPVPGQGAGESAAGPTREGGDPTGTARPTPVLTQRSRAISKGRPVPLRAGKSNPSRPFVPPALKAGPAATTPTETRTAAGFLLRSSERSAIRGARVPTRPRYGGLPESRRWEEMDALAQIGRPCAKPSRPNRSTAVAGTLGAGV